MRVDLKAALVAALLISTGIATSDAWADKGRSGGDDDREGEREIHNSSGSHSSSDLGRSDNGQKNDSATPPSSNPSGNGNVDGSAGRLRLTARLIGSLSSRLDNPHGKARRETKNKDNKLKESFTAKIEIPLPNVTLQLADASAARAADVNVVLSRAGTAYAACTLGLDEIEFQEDDDDSLLEAEYKVTVEREIRRGQLKRFRSKHGVCDVDLATDGVQTGLPDVVAGDTVTVTMTVGGAAVQIASGQF